MSSYVSAVSAIIAVMYVFVATTSSKLYTVPPELPDDRNESRPGKLLECLRVRAGFPSVRAAAKVAGVSHTRLNELEAALGRLGMTLGTMQRLASTYRVPLKAISDIASGAITNLDDEDFLTNPSSSQQATISAETESDRLHFVTLKVIGSKNKGEVSLLEDYLRGRSSGDVLAVEAVGSIMVCPELRVEARDRRYLIDTKMKPKEGDVVAYCVKGTNRVMLVVFREREEPVTVQSFDLSDAYIIRKNRSELDMLGTSFFDYREGRRSDRLIHHS